MCVFVYLSLIENKVFRRRSAYDFARHYFRPTSVSSDSDSRVAFEVISLIVNRCNLI